MMGALGRMLSDWSLGGRGSAAANEDLPEDFMAGGKYASLQTSDVTFLASGNEATYEGMMAFGAAWPVVEPSMKHFARIITKDKDDQADLIQEVMVKLWECDPTRYDFTNKKDVSYVKAMLINKMWDAWNGGKTRFRSQKAVDESVALDSAGEMQRLRAEGALAALHKEA